MQQIIDGVVPLVKQHQQVPVFVPQMAGAFWIARDIARLWIRPSSFESV